MLLQGLRAPSMICLLNMNATLKYCVFATILIFSVKIYNVNGKRTKRTLIYIPPGGVVQLVMGVGLPLVLQQESVIVGLVLKGGYHLPTNSTDFTNPNVVYAKRKRSVTRWDLYEVMSQAVQMYGLGEKGCILRSICELAEVPLDTSRSLFEELVHAILTPSSTHENLKQHSDNIYHAAEQIGKKSEESCEAKFPECQVSLVDIFTKYLDVS